MRPMTVGRQDVHHVGLPWHWGYQGLVTGAVTNDLSLMVGDPNVTIHEAKAFVCNVEKAWGTLRVMAVPAQATPIPSHLVSHSRRRQVQCNPPHMLFSTGAGRGLPRDSDAATLTTTRKLNSENWRHVEPVS